MWLVSLLLYVFGGLGLIAMIHDYKSPPAGKTKKDAARGMLTAALLVFFGYVVSPDDKPASPTALPAPVVATAPAPAPEKSRAEIEAEQAKADAEKDRQAKEQAEAEVAKLKEELAQAQAAAEQAKAAPAPDQKPEPEQQTQAVAAQALLSTPGKDAPEPENADCTLSGKVVSVTDGDTLKLLDADNKQHTIRLAGIDAPEKAQAFGNAAKKHLGELVADKQICTSGSKIDKYGRTVAKVMLDGADIDLQMVKDGYAWHFKKYEGEQSQEDRDAYASAHDQAKSDTIGLWSEPDPIEPDAWRAGERPQKAAAKAKPAAEPEPQEDSGGGGSCDGKRFCKQMSSCAEARHYLNDCGVHRLDADSDGVPCESICGGG
jgi:endonuclease YncB( thermonuclease family)